jgi:hypothetical protein
MANNSLPSVDDVKVVTDAKVEGNVIKVSSSTLGEIASEGYLPRSIDVKMNRNQAARFREIARSLEDDGATLKDGTPVNNRRRVVLWMIENQPIETR